MSRSGRPCRYAPIAKVRGLAGSQHSEPGECLCQHFFLLAECKPDLELSRVNIVVEDDTGNCDDAGRIWEFSAEFQAAHLPEWPDIRRNKVGTRRPEHLEAGRREPVAHEFTPGEQPSRDRPVVVVR